MLKQLTITNYALIAQTDIEFNAGLTVITGETGAGKSIMLGALGLLLGQRADVQVLLDKEKKCVVEATFDVSAYDVQSLFEEEDVEYEVLTIIRREILPSGKSRAFVNDTPVNLTFLKALSQKLIDIHSQHQNLLLSDESFHLNVIDAVAQTQSLLTDYSLLYKEYRNLLNEETEMLATNDKMKADSDYMSFQYNQLNDARLQEDELAELELERERLVNAEEIKSELSFVVAALGDENAVVPTLDRVSSRLQKVSKYLPADEDYLARIETARIDMADILKSLDRTNEGIEYDHERLVSVERRLDLLYSLMQKHQVQDVASLIEIRDSLNEKLGQISSFDEAIEALRKRLTQQRDILKTKGDELSDCRKNVFGKVKEYIEAQLREMGMENARFEIEHATTADFTSSGIDSVRFLFAANRNGVPTDISKVASGGEMSRVMLAIKWLLSQSKGLPTIIFDEIDTGVSGEVADKMGRIMTEMGEHIQVIAITHLPQVAAKGSTHFKVYKQDDDTRTTSNIMSLDAEQRIEELAKMLSGATVTNAALENAKMLIESNNK
jgi:DNA repair protein RecN (Recombination protein N)